PGMSRIFIVEDEPKLAAALREHLSRYGHEAVTATRFDDLKAEFVEVDPDLVLLDVNLPWYDGFYWCRQFRPVSKAPIVFITAQVRPAQRRAYGASRAATTTDAGAVEHAGLSYDPHRLEAAYAGRRAVLSRNEGLLLESLLRARGRVVRRASLLQALWDDEEF